MTRTGEIAFADNTIGPVELEAVTAVLKSGWISADRVTAAFETEFARALGLTDAVFVSSGTAALHLAVLALGLRPGDEVIMPSLTFVAGAAVCALHGIVPVFADIRSDVDLTIDVSDVARLIGPRTAAVVVTHYGGYPARTAEIVALARRHGLAVIEDAAHAPVVRSTDGMLGTIGDVGCFSFFATKNLTTGEGGMVVSGDHATLARVRARRSHHIDGTSRSRASAGGGYDVAGIGLNYRPTEIAAALGRVQLGKLDADRSVRRDLVARYHRRLAEIPSITVPFADAGGDSAHHLLPVLAAPSLRDSLRADGIPTSQHYPPTHLLSYYREDPDGLRRGAAPRERLTRTEAVAGRLFSLPLHAKMTAADVAFVTDRLGAAVARTRP